MYVNLSYLAGPEKCDSQNFEGEKVSNFFGPKQEKRKNDNKKAIQIRKFERVNEVDNYSKDKTSWWGEKVEKNIKYSNIHKKNWLR